MLEVDLNSFEARHGEWWDVPRPDSLEQVESGPKTSSEWEELVDSKLRECVKRQLVSDVPLGALLSGGVDSSLVVASMGRALAFSIGFDPELSTSGNTRVRLTCRR